MRSARWARTEASNQRKTNGRLIEIDTNAKSKNVELDPFLGA